MTKDRIAQTLSLVFGDVSISEEDSDICPSIEELQIEAIVHELCHAAVLGVDAMDPEIDSLETVITTRFKTMAGRASDHSEAGLFRAHVDRGRLRRVRSGRGGSDGFAGVLRTCS